MEKKNKINMLSPEEMQKEKISSSKSSYDQMIKEACFGKLFGDHCEWQDETALMHYGLCKYDFSAPRLTLICIESPGGSGTTTESGALL